MAEKGIPLVQVYGVRQPKETVMQRLVAVTAGTPGYTVSPSGPNILVFTRKYWPTWVIVVAVLGALFYLLGLLALLYRKTETLTAAVTSEADGTTRVAFSGVASRDLHLRIQSAMRDLCAESVGRDGGA